MAKSATSYIFEQGLDYVEQNAKRLFVNTSDPATYAEASSTGQQMLAEHTLTSADFTITTGDVSGYKVRMSSQTTFAISASGTASHVTVATTSTLIFVTTCTTQALTTGNTVSVPAIDNEIADPT